jgi:DNA-binding response OmpR family regulator
MQGNSRKILIVDDDPAILRLLARLLNEEYWLSHWVWFGCH